MNHELRHPKEVEEILRIAINDDGRTADEPVEVDLRRQLMAVGQELGLTPEQIEIAETRWREEKERRELTEFKRFRLYYYRAHLVCFLFVAIFLGTLGALEYIDQTLVTLFLTLGGVGLFFHRHEALNPESEGFRKNFRHWRELQAGEG
jgi:hypothetical protein